MRVAFQGEIGAYSQEAIQLLEGSSAEPLPRRTFREAFQADWERSFCADQTEVK